MLDYKRYKATPGLRHSWIDGPFRDKISKNRIERLYQRFHQPMPGFPKELEGRWTYAHMFPATMVDMYPDQLDTWTLVPDGPDRTRTVSWVYVPHEESLRAKAVRRINWHINSLVMKEDDALTSAVQTGLESRTYERGVLNGNENAVWHFHDMLRAVVPGIDEP